MILKMCALSSTLMSIYYMNKSMFVIFFCYNLSVEKSLVNWMGKQALKLIIKKKLNTKFFISALWKAQISVNVTLVLWCESQRRVSNNLFTSVFIYIFFSIHTIYFISHRICWYRKVVSQSDYRVFILACSATHTHKSVYIRYICGYI